MNTMSPDLARRVRARLDDSHYLPQPVLLADAPGGVQWAAIADRHIKIITIYPHGRATGAYLEAWISPENPAIHGPLLHRMDGDVLAVLDWLEPSVPRHARPYVPEDTDDTLGWAPTDDAEQDP
jgi:hypothetical protein